MVITGAWARRRLQGLAVGVLAAGLSAWGLTVPAQASPVVAGGLPVVAEATPEPATVSADALPTWQINGAVFQQVVIGNTVYAVGSFTEARPPGVPAGDPSSIPANNIFAFDIRTGNPVPGFSHQLDGQALAIVASTDQSRIYIGGDFTTVDGVARGHLAAFDVATGALLADWTPRTDGQVRALAVTGSTVYVGGNFRSANGLPRNLLAAFHPTTGVMNSWAPSVDNGYVWTMTMTPDQASVVVGGSFTVLSGTDQYGMGKIDAATGAIQPWLANQRIQTAGAYGAITSLRTDGTQIFGSGYAFGTGARFEGSFAADPASGAINWVNDCLGDTYDVYPFEGLLYSVGHTHDCSVVGGFNDTSPRSRWQPAMANSLTPTGTIGWKDAYGWDFTGLPYAGIKHWYPSLGFGTYTASKQAAWTLTGANGYLVLGGEFPIVNGKSQQGLTRFATRSAAPKKMGPVYSPDYNPTVTSPDAGQVRVRWVALWDRDQSTLSYDVFRNGARVGTIADVASSFWNVPGVSYLDTGLTPGASCTYQLRATDADGNVQWSTTTAPIVVSATSATTTPYEQLVRRDGATHLWRLGESAGATATVDSIGAADLVPESMTFGGQSSIPSDPDTSARFTATGARATTQAGETATAQMTVEAWIKTTSTSGGRIAGFGTSGRGTSAMYDRVLYLENSGRVNLATLGDTTTSVRSTISVNDGVWHHVVGVVGRDGSAIYVDGRLVGRDARMPFVRPYDGMWKLGADATSALPNRPSSNVMVGDIDNVATYPTELSGSAIAEHYVAAGRTLTLPATPTDAYAQVIVADRPDIYWRLGESSGRVQDYSGHGHEAVVSGSVAYGQPGALTGTTDTGLAFTTSLFTQGGYVIDQTGFLNPLTYSTEVWFKTNALTRGGKLIGFGSATSGLSASYDRHVYLTDNGRVRFGTFFQGTQYIVESPASYGDQQWHHVVASQDKTGMKLYVDGVQVGTNPNTRAGDYLGYWRLAQDKKWSGTYNYFLGSLDEAAVYPRALSLAEVQAHFQAGSGRTPNQGPTAAFTSTTSGLTASMDASTSVDTDGTIASYAWEFGDGGTATGVTTTRTYAAPGTYTVKLTVTDNQGAVSTISQPVVINAPTAPVAAFTSTVNKLAVAVDGHTSTDADGTIASYEWDFGDSATGTGVTATHTYAAAGTYTITLKVTDNSGLSHTVTAPVTVVANAAPVAAFTKSVNGLAVSVDGSTSSDADGTVASYAWTFGDGGTATGATASHTYAAAGTYTVTLVVTDNDGSASAVSTQSVVVRQNQAPVAAFTANAAQLDVSVDGSTSSDADGTIASYDWAFGDGGTATGATASHRYAAAGSYQVTLTVTDNDGGTASSTSTVVVTGPTALAADTFARTLTGSWGPADTGGTWATGGPAARWSVSNNTGQVSLNAGDGYTAVLPISQADTDAVINVTTDKAPTGGGQYVSMISRYSAGVGDYRAKVRFVSDGKVVVWLTKTVGTTTITLNSVTVPGLTYQAGKVLRMRMVTVGSAPTTLKFRIWDSAGTEPTAWALTATDSSPTLAAPGSFGLYPYSSASTTNSPTVFSFSDFKATEVTP